MAQTLKFGNGTWATKKGSTLAHNDEGGNFKPLPFTYTGAGKGTRVNKEGLIEVVENDRPRIDYLDSEDGALLLEPSRSNLITYSQDFSNSYWSKVSITATDNYGISPDGELNSSRVYSSNAQSNHRVFRTFNFSNSTYTVSVYAKSNGSNQSFRMSRYDGNQYFSDDFILTNEWQRYTWTFNSDAFTGGDLWLVTTSSIGVGSELDIQIYAAQLEQGSYATSYIPTQGTIQTRVQETASGSGNSEVFNSEQGILYANISTDSEDTYKYISINNGTSTGNQTRVALGYYGSTLYPNVRVSNAHQFSEAFSINPTLNNKIALKYKTNDFALWVNGFEVLESNSGSTFSDGTLSKFDFDDGASSSDFYGSTKEIGYYDTVLTEEELEYMTSYRSLSEMLKELNIKAL